MSDKQDARSLRLGQAPLGSLLWHYALPAVVGTLVIALYNLVDRIFIGQTEGAYAMAGLTLTFPVLIFLQAFGMLIGSGAAARISILLGRQDLQGAKIILGNAIILSCTLSLTMSGLVYLFLDDLLCFFGGSSESIPYAHRYLAIIIPGNILSVLSMSYNAIMRASGYPRKAMYTMLIGAVVNTLLDYLFIYGWGWGIEGAAWATIIAMFASACFVMYHFFNKRSLVHFEWAYIRPCRQAMRAILSIGLSPFTVQMLGAISSVLINRRFVSYAPSTHDADMAISALGVINSYVMIGFFVMIGFAQAMQPIVGYNYGSGQHGRVLRATLMSGGICAGLGLSMTFGGYFLKEHIIALFTQDTSLHEASLKAFDLCIYSFTLVGTQIIATQFFQSIGYVRTSFVLSIARQAFFLIPLIIFLPECLGLDGVWLSLPISDALSGLMGLIFFAHYFRQNK